MTVCALIVFSCVPLWSGVWWELQRLGQVPEGVIRGSREGDHIWRMAESTTWWGKPLDPAKFWQGKVIWNDASAVAEANRRGRALPPIPTHRPELTPGFSGKTRDIVPGPFSGGLDGGRVTPFHYTELEYKYWTSYFWRTHPKPPATLEREQHEVAKTILQMRKPLLIRGEDIHGRMRPEERARSESTQKESAKAIGVPIEALTEDALFWAYVLKQRLEYANERAQADQWRPRNNQIAEDRLCRFLERVAVDPKFIIEPLTKEQIDATTRWKYEYLKRLRTEKTDESYINAYVETWKLDRAIVFGEKEKN